MLNDHSWNQLNTPWDWVRAILWTGSNLATAASYFAIPWEIWQWRKELPFLSARLIGWLFVAFIVACGYHHLVDALIMQTAPWWAVLTGNVPMAIVSVWTALIVRRERAQIVQVLASLTRILAGPIGG